MQDRNWKIPFQPRTKFSERRTEKPCKHFGNASPDSRLLAPYDTCVLRFTESDFLSIANKTIVLYVNHRMVIHSWVETCDIQLDTCQWEKVEQGTSYHLTYKQNIVKSFLFESDTPYYEDFMLTYTLGTKVAVTIPTD